MNRTQSPEEVHWGTIFLEDSLQAIDLLFQVESVYTNFPKENVLPIFNVLFLEFDFRILTYLRVNTDNRFIIQQFLDTYLSNLWAYFLAEVRDQII